MKNKVFKDSRGTHMKFFDNMKAEELGFKGVREIFSTINNKGTIRAFHYQGSPRPQQKIVKPLSGSFNVRVIDLENNEIIEYDNVNRESDPIFVKAGNMLGYVSLEDNSIMLYIADEEFVSELNHGVHPESFNVNWKFPEEVTISERDLDAEIVSFDTIWKFIEPHDNTISLERTEADGEVSLHFQHEYVLLIIRAYWELNNTGFFWHSEK